MTRDGKDVALYGSVDWDVDGSLWYSIERLCEVRKGGLTSAALKPRHPTRAAPRPLSETR